tara:strand:+ start:3743 stop:3895 length:153 start_codon:yes stop_codon:yes gene_type:complete
MRYITAPYKTILYIFKTLTLVFLIIKMLEMWSTDNIKINNIDKEKTGNGK